MGNKKLPVLVQSEFTIEQIQDLLITAFEGGSNYWVGAVDGAYQNLAKSDYIIVVHDEQDDDKYTLGLVSFIGAFQLMADNHPRLFKDLINFADGGWDANTADVFLQLACFKEVVYG